MKMNTATRLAAALLCTLAGTAQAADWQIVLLKPPDCDDCTLVEEILKRSSQLQRVTLDDGAGNVVSAPILRRSSGVLSAQEWTELHALPWFDETTWRQRAASASAQILLKRDGIVVSGGDIRDSVDLRTARYPNELVTPNVGANPVTVRNGQGSYASGLFMRSWNLNWFYRLALDPSLPKSRTSSSWLSEAAGLLAPPLGAANVMLMSTASGAADNEIFNALRIEEIRGVLKDSLALDPSQLRIYYGGGNTPGANALELREQRVGLVRRDVADATPASPDAVARIFQSIRARPGSRNLLVLVGHGNPNGAGMWSSPTQLAPATLRALHEHGGGDDVLVSGNCFGGVMARAMSCGFFGARPDLIATGCQADAAEVAQSRDYLHMFFSSLKPEARSAADVNSDGIISFAESHWYASVEGDPRNVTYTGIDALADAWFDSHPDKLPRNITVGEALALAADAPAGEAHALRNLLNGQDASRALPMQYLSTQGLRWQPGTGTPRALASQLVRRLLYLRDADSTQRAELARLQTCENRSVAAFLRQ